MLQNIIRENMLIYLFIYFLNLQSIPRKEEN